MLRFECEKQKKGIQVLSGFQNVSLDVIQYFVLDVTDFSVPQRYHGRLEGPGSRLNPSSLGILSLLLSIYDLFKRR